MEQGHRNVQGHGGDKAFPMNSYKSKQRYFQVSDKGKITDLSIPEIDFKSLKSCSN